MAKFFPAFVFAAITFFHSSVNSGPLNQTLSASVLSPEITITSAGEDFAFVEDQPNLNYEDVYKVCKTGLWVVYTGHNYSMGDGPSGASSFIQTVDYACFPPMASTVGSARLVGFRSNPAAPSVTLYSGIGMQDRSLVFDEGIPQIDFTIKSLFTISAQVELFEKPNYEGQSYCVDPLPNDCYDGICVVLSWRFYGKPLPWEVAAAKSAKFGCQSQSSKTIGAGISINPFPKESAPVIYYKNSD